MAREEAADSRVASHAVRAKAEGKAGQGVTVRIMGFSKKDSLVKNFAGKDNKTKLYRGASELYDTVFQKKIKISPVIVLTPAIYQVFDDDVLGLFTRPT